MTGPIPRPMCDAGRQELARRRFVEGYDTDRQRPGDHGWPCVLLCIGLALAIAAGLAVVSQWT
jgi:hypothetical protein